MPYSLELPDGSLMEDIPDDVKPKAALSKWVDKIHKPQPGLPAEVDMSERSFMDNLMAATGRGVTNVARNVARYTTPTPMRGPDTKEILGLTDEVEAERDLRDKQLTDTPGGAIGEVVGEVAATMFPGGGAIKGMQGASKLLNASSKLPKASKFASRVIGSTPALLAAEGATVGALTADDIGEGAGLGAAIGSGLGFAGKLGKKIIDKTGTGWIKKSDEAVATEKLIGEDLPISMSAESPATRFVFGEILPFLPGRNIANQVKSAKEAIKKTSLKESSPGKMYNASDADDLAKHFSDGYNSSVGQRAINMTDEWVGPHRVVDDISRITKKYIDNDTVSGKSIGTVRRKLADLVDRNFDDEAYKTVLQQFDQKVVDDLSRGPRGKPSKANKVILDDYTELNEGYDVFRAMLNKADEATGVTKGILEGAKGTARNIFQKLAANSVGKSLITMAGLSGSAASTVMAGLSGAAMLASTKTGQKALTGSSAGQKLLRKAIDDPRTQQGLVQGGRKAGMMGTPVITTEQSKDKYGSY